MSRLCRNNMIDFSQEFTPETTMSANIIEKFKLTSEQYNTIKYTTHKLAILVLSAL
jgi:hypothetical protein